MRWLLAISSVLTFLLTLWLGYWLGKRSKAKADKKLPLLVVALGLSVILFRVALPPHLEFVLFPYDWYAVIRAWWVLPFALLVLGVGTTHMESRFSRRGVALFAAVVLFCGVHRLGATALFDPKTVVGVVNEEGVCLQSTDYTCGAAAAATLLAHYGIEADEREMAERCWTNSLTGTDVFCVARGLRQKISGQNLEVRVVSSDWAQLLQREKPAMAVIKWGILVDHWVVVLEANEARALVADPVKGVVAMSKEDFLRVWRGSLVTLER